MPLTLSDVMTPDPLTVEASTPVPDAARIMRDHDIGDVLVTEGGALFGIVTDRDIAVRGVAENDQLHMVTVGDICSTGVATVAPGDSLDKAVALMRDHAVRRLPVVDSGRPVGVVTIGDLAIEQDPDSPLADISSAPPD